MNERIFEFDTVNPIEIFGVHNEKISKLRQFFPKLKIIARGNTLKVLGEPRDIDNFELTLEGLTAHYRKYNKITDNDILRIVEQIQNGETPDEENLKSGGAREQARDKENIILYGSSGEAIRAKTPNQKKMVTAVAKNDMLFAIGPAGTGKTYTAVALAVKAFKNKEVKRIILTRPAVEAGENLGFLPGDLKEKLDPYLQPLYDALRDMIPAERLADLIEKGQIQIAPLAFMRGRTLDNAFVILDEAQNATESQLKMFLTRMGQTAKFIITGDLTQIDLPKRQPSGLVQANGLLQNVKGISFVYLDEKDVIRHKLVKEIISRYKTIEH